MKLHLIQNRHNLCLFQEHVKKLWGEIADSNSSTPWTNEFLHLFPYFHKRWTSWKRHGALIWVQCSWLVHQKYVDVLYVQVMERVLECRFDFVETVRPDLRDKRDLGSGNTRIADGIANNGFNAIILSCVDQAITRFKGMDDGLFQLL